MTIILNVYLFKCETVIENYYYPLSFVIIANNDKRYTELLSEIIC